MGARLAFLGTPEAAVPSLRAVVRAGHQVVTVVTRPDRRRGRGGALSPSPVKEAAHDLGLPVTHQLEDIRTSGAELGVVVAYGRIIPAPLLAEVPMVNVHFSLLPHWRGAAPVERAILAGDEVTGVCVMAVEPELDTGPVFARREVPIGPDETAADLRASLAEVGAELLASVLDGAPDALPEPEPQAGRPTYAEKVSPEELALEWEQPAAQLARVVRIGRAWTTFRGRRLRVTGARAEADGGARSEPPGTMVGERVVAGEGWLVPLSVVPEGGRAMAFGDWRRGVRPDPGERLGTE